MIRLAACRKLEQARRAEKGQFLTPAPVARLMASMLSCPTRAVSLLDAGAGVGSLFAACVEELCGRNERPSEIRVTAYEIDPLLLPHLANTVELCRARCERAGIFFAAEIKPEDFIEDARNILSGGLFARPFPAYTCAILNPPYRKIHSQSKARQLLRQVGLETSNLYTGFLACALKLLATEGEMAAITPRSFCNGTYFRPFRQLFLSEMAIRGIHLFDSRVEAFSEEDILQETVIVHAARRAQKPERVAITSSTGAEDDLLILHEAPYEEVIHPGDPERFIHVVPDTTGQTILSRMARFRATLVDLGLSVSTGRIVDFRARNYLRQQPEAGTAPLLYPMNCENGSVCWPKRTKKPQALLECKETESLLIPNENYVLVKRFTSKEQERRVVATLLESGHLPGDWIGLENHLNYFHQDGKGLPATLAKGLYLFLNSSLVDAYFRQFSGHTQVNAGDLRSLKYPAKDELYRLGQRVTSPLPTQAEIDRLIAEKFFFMADVPQGDSAAAKRIQEARAILEALGFPETQINERSALTLLALLDLGPRQPWPEAAQPLRGITPLMEFMEREYARRYMPNTRETVRRQTVHQFLDAGLVVANPDAPNRPINSPHYVYQIETSALEMLRAFGSNEWDQALQAYLASRETLRQRYAQEREMTRIPIQIAPGVAVTLSPGGQNVLVEHIIHEFAPRFTPNGRLLYVGDTDEKFAYFDAEAFALLGLSIDAHGKMPDVIIHHPEKNWLVLVEAVTSHGPIDPKRKTELEALFAGATEGLVFVTAFLNRTALVQYLPSISWETEVWIAESPGHLIHFNGERFLGPY